MKISLKASDCDATYKFLETASSATALPVITQIGELILRLYPLRIVRNAKAW